MMFWLIPTLFMVSFAGLAYVILKAVLSGAETYSISIGFLIVDVKA